MTRDIRRAIRTGAAAGIVAGAVAFFHAAAAADGDVMRGEELAKRWCAHCHVVDTRGSGTAIDQAPPFPSMAGRSADVLRRAVTGPHIQMPELNIGRRDLDDLVGYIRSLGGKR